MRGGDSSALRAYNERLIVSAILRDGALSKAELARTTGLSAQSVMVIANSLIEQGLLMKLEPVRGQVGQPYTPIAVNPDGAYAVGIKIGRRSVESLLVNFAGEIVSQCEKRHQFPDPRPTVDVAISLSRELLTGLDGARHPRVIGLGIAMPNQLEAWAPELGLEAGALDGWRTMDVAGELSRATGLEAMLYNDSTAACAAEMMAGDGTLRRTALYIYFGTFIGGGIVIGGRLYRGERQNAGSIGSMPATGTGNGSGQDQLIHLASLLQLEALLERSGLDPACAISDVSAPEADEAFARWMDTAVPAVARAIVSALSVIDFEVVVIDGRLPAQWRQRLTSRIRDDLERQNLSGLLPTDLVTGSVGPIAPSLGAAMLPLRVRFTPDPDLLVRSTGSGTAGTLGGAG